MSVRIAYVISTLDRCGPVNVLHDIVRRLAPDHELAVFTLAAEPAGSRAADFEALGVPVRRVQGILMVTAALMTAVMVSVVGAIGFVGLVIPHVARLLVGVRHHRLLPASALIGALFLMLADITSRVMIKGQVLPIGVVTALVGAPVFAFILLGRGKAQR